MTDREALLEAALDNMHADRLLVYADTLEDAGRTRHADFVRLLVVGKARWSGGRLKEPDNQHNVEKYYYYLRKPVILAVVARRRDMNPEWIWQVRFGESGYPDAHGSANGRAATQRAGLHYLLECQELLCWCGTSNLDVVLARYRMTKPAASSP